MPDQEQQTQLREPRKKVHEASGISANHKRSHVNRGIYHIKCPICRFRGRTSMEALKPATELELVSS
jgi:hypothetical protein